MEGIGVVRMSEVIHSAFMTPGFLRLKAAAKHCGVTTNTEAGLRNTCEPSIPTGLRPPAQGCDSSRRSQAKAEARAALGKGTKDFSTPTELRHFGPVAARPPLKPRLATQKVQKHTSHSKRFARYFAIVALWFCLAASHTSATSLLLTGATVHTVSGESFSPGQLFVRDAKIVSVGTTVPGEGTQAIDLSGLHLYPGMIALDSVLGLTE